MRWYERFFRREFTEKRLDAELRFHLEQRIADLVAGGMTAKEAWRQARIEFGGLEHVKEECRDVGGSHIIETVIQDLRYGLRQLRRNPGFTTVAVLTLALGIGTNTTIFSAVSAILLRKPPVKEPDRLCAVSSKNLIKGCDLEPVSPLDFESWREQNNVFEAVAADAGASFTLTGDGEPESVAGDRVTPGYFKILGVLPTLGRAFLPGEATAGNDRVVILSNPLWRERFNSDPNVIGKNLEINGEPYTVVGVMPPVASSFSWLAFPRLWTPLAFEPKDLAPSSRDNRYVGLVFGRLKPGVTTKQAQAEMGSIASRLAQAYPKADKGWGITVQTLQEYEIRSAYVTNGLMLLMTVVGLVLLIACANIAGLLLARGAGRAHELAVRAAVGASRVRLLRQMLVESLLISALGGAAGLLMSVWGIDLLRAGFNFNDYGRQQAAGFRMDPATLLFTLMVSLLAAFVFGLVPALRASKANPGDALGETGRTGSSGFPCSRLRSALVTCEIALALVLLAGAGIVIREVIREFTEPNGFNPNHVVVAQIDLKGKPYQKPAAQIALFQQVTGKVRGIAGVESAGADTCVPTGCNSSTPFSIQGEPPVPETKRPSADYFVVGPGYFRTMQIPLIKGREFSDSDDTRAPVVAVVNQEFARRFFPKSDAIGRQFEVDRGQNKKAEIVGIVGNVNDYIGQLTPRPQIYESYLQMAQATMALVVRSRLAPSALAPMLRRAVWSVDKGQPVGRIQTMQDLAADNMGGDKMMVALMAIFAGLALVLAAVGIYGVVAYSVNQRTREIGIRMALGAQKKQVLGLVLRQGNLLTGIGCAIGIVLTLPLPRLFAGMFNGFADHGPLVLIIVPFLVGTVSLLATYIPARRATKVDPMVALRHE
ncbi:MAG TPA: ABC transporter permease [Terriglobia bacterium]|nr:ABC transporter permease [Terriglobia bacterium]